ncbi:winged helix-turn-helix domain-containing protein [Microbispora sp. CA-135349]|uniref:winged helix-turn-helix domain-containing protein n=1 Tax=Microbispora sp. CA-135349 TaxID=3239953 RepID=UPI003D8C5E5D
MRLLVVEDDRRLADALGVALRRRGYSVTHAATATAAKAVTDFDLMLLDLRLGGEDGLEVCRHFRRSSDVGIIILTARCAERDRVLGLRTGADDYVVKPFSMAELEARIQAVLRRSSRRPPRTLTYGDLRLDLNMHVVTYRDQPIDLTPKEFALLVRLARAEGQVVSRDQLLLDIWQTVSREASRTLTVHMTTLRAKLGDPALVGTLRGVGYRLNIAPAPGSAA